MLAWDLMIRARQLRQVTPLLEAVLSKITRQQISTKAEQRPEDVSQQLVNIRGLLQVSQTAVPANGNLPFNSFGARWNTPFRHCWKRID